MQNSHNTLFNSSELIRYSRHFSLFDVGIEGQEKLKKARILCVGAGALGSVVLPILVSAGIGQVGIADDDIIELSNLHRQTLYRTDDIGKSKIAVASQRLQALNPDIKVIPHDIRVNLKNAQDVIKNYNYVIDCTDNLPSRYLLSAVCVRQKIPYIYGGIYQFSGQCTILSLPQAPCYHCLFPECPPTKALPNCAEAGVLSSLPAIIGAFQTTEVFKLILGIGSPLIGKMLNIDALSLSINCYKVKKINNCVSCGNEQLADLSKLIKQPEACSFQQELEISPEQAKLEVTHSKMELLDVRENYEREINNIGGHHIPLALLPQHIEQLKAIKKPLLVYCAGGMRSIQAVRFLKQHQIECYSLEGGIQRWLKEFS